MRQDIERHYPCLHQRKVQAGDEYPIQKELEQSDTRTRYESNLRAADEVARLSLSDNLSEDHPKAESCE